MAGGLKTVTEGRTASMLNSLLQIKSAGPSSFILMLWGEKHKIEPPTTDSLGWRSSPACAEGFSFSLLPSVLCHSFCYFPANGRSMPFTSGLSQEELRVLDNPKSIRQYEQVTLSTMLVTDAFTVPYLYELSTCRIVGPAGFEQVARTSC